MKRPYIVCHMIMSIDGKTTGEFMWWEDKYPISAAYAAKIEEYAPKAYIGGRKSIQAFTQNRPMDLVCSVMLMESLSSLTKCPMLIWHSYRM